MTTQIIFEFLGFEETINALGYIPSELSSVIEHELHRGANIIARTAKDLCPVGKREFTYSGIVGIKETSLKNSVEVTKGDEELEYYIGTNHPAAGYVEYGTTPHIIRHRFKKALKFIWEGEEVFRNFVHHPGTYPQPFLEPALFRHQDEIQDSISRVINKAIEKYGAGID